MPGPLEGIKVLDFSHARAGPHCAMMLGDMGANVIKLERPGGESGRKWGPTYRGEKIDFMSVNRNKRSVTVDLSDASDLTLVRELAAQADVIVQNLRPGVMAKFGLDAETLRQSNPGLVYCSISGLGAKGREAMEPSYDNVAQARSGLMSITGTTEPVRSGLPLADLLTGVFAAGGIMAALVERAKSGLGQHVQVSLMETLISLMSFHAMNYLLLGKVPGLAGNHHPIMAPTGLYAVRDGQIVIAVSQDVEWTRLCHALGLDALIEDPRFATNDSRVANRDELNRILNQRLSQNDRNHWIEALRVARVPAGSVNTVGEALDDEQVRANDMVLEMEHPTLGRVPMLGFPVKLDRTPWELRLFPPSAGQHTEEVRNARSF